MKEGEGDWNDVARVKALDTDYKVRDLVPGKSYHFRVEAENDVGRGDAVETTAPVVLKKKAGEISIQTVNAFPHRTILQQTTLNVFCQHIENLHN